MLCTEKFDALITSLRQSLNNYQYENLGKLFDKDAQYAFSANSYGTLMAFNAEFKRWLFNADKDRLNEYVKDVYYPIARYGVLFTCLVQDYERQLVGNSQSQLSSESYELVYAYQEAIRHEAATIRRDATKYAKVDLSEFQELTLDSFTIDGKYIDKPAPANDQTRLTDGEQPGFDTYIDEQHRTKLMPYLIQHYTNKKPRVIVPVLYALETLGILTCKVDRCDQTNLHNTLTTTFGNVGRRTSLNSSLPLYHKDSISSTKRQKVEQHKQQIEAFLKNEQRQ